MLVFIFNKKYIFHLKFFFNQLYLIEYECVSVMYVHNNTNLLYIVLFKLGTDGVDTVSRFSIQTSLVMVLKPLYVQPKLIIKKILISCIFL